MEMKVEKCLEKQVSTMNNYMIKPSSPTPDHKRYVKLSLLDQLSPSVHIMLVLFYPPPPSINGDKVQRRLALVKSLSEALTRFYPYAGRIINNSFIECTDEGVVYGESEVNFRVSEVLLHRDPGTVQQFLPDIVDLDGLERIPLLIQANFFECGGLAIGVLASHRIMDGVGITTFIRSWAAAAGTSDADCDLVELITPDFTIPSIIYPPSDRFNSMPEKFAMPRPDDVCVTKRYIFTDSSIAALNAKLGNPIAQPTRVGAVSSLIWKCAIKSSRSSSSSSSSSSTWVQAVNTRTRLSPPLPDNTPGNNAYSFVARTRVHDDVEARDLIQHLKNGLREFCDNRLTKLQDSVSSVRCSAILDGIVEFGNNMKESDADVYVHTSWCGFKLYDADFGWGKPEWIGFPNFVFKNMIIFMDTKDGNGIEAWVALKEEHMVAFEQDEDLLLFANNSTS